MKTQIMLAAAALFAVCLLRPAAAQSDEEAPSSPGAVVSATAVAKIERQPDTMRLQIDLLAKGSDVKEALALLGDRIQAARLQVIGFGAAEDSLVVGKPRLATSKSNEQRQIEAMIAERLRGRGGRSKKAASTPVTVSAELTAEWKLNTESIEDLLVSTQDLQEKIKQADLSGLKEASKLSAEEQELLEEFESEYGGYGSRNESKPGEPAFLFVSKLSDKDRDKALADAFQAAKSKAARLAKAAGLQLGPLKTLNGQTALDTPDEDYNYFGYQSSASLAYARALAGQAEGGEMSEAVGTRPHQVTYKVTVSASFHSKPQ